MYSNNNLQSKWSKNDLNSWRGSQVRKLRSWVKSISKWQMISFPVENVCFSVLDAYYKLHEILHVNRTFNHTLMPEICSCGYMYLLTFTNLTFIDVKKCNCAGVARWSRWGNVIIQISFMVAKPRWCQKLNFIKLLRKSFTTKPHTWNV